MSEYRCENLTDFVTQLAKAQERGASVVMEDGLRDRVLGYRDLDSETHYTLSLTKLREGLISLRESIPLLDVIEQLGFKPGAFVDMWVSVESRKALIEHRPPAPPKL